MTAVRIPIPFLAVGSAAALLAGCDYPTSAPILEQRWIIEVEGTSMSITELLPTGVDTAGGNFTMNIDPVSNNETLGNLCASCFDSAVPVPVPAFNGPIIANQGLPTDVSGATVASGSMDITIQNDFDFDPLENGGTITVSLIDDQSGDTVGTVAWTGPTDMLPTGTSDTKTLVLAPGLIGANLTVATQVDCPGGQNSTMNTADLMTVTATPSTLAASDVLVQIVNKSVTFGPEPMDTEDVPSDIVDKIVSGGIVLRVVNPFGITLSGTLDLGTVSKALNVSGSASSTTTLSYTATELKSILGQSGINFQGTAVANASGPVAIAPTQELVLEPSIDFTVQIGG